MIFRRYVWVFMMVAALCLVPVLACESTPETNEAEQTFCTDAANLEEALSDLTTPRAGMTVGELREAKDQAVNAAGDTRAAAEDYVDAARRDLQEASDNLDKAVQDLPDDVDITQAMEEISDEVIAVREAWARLIQGPTCEVEDQGQ